MKKLILTLLITLLITPTCFASDNYVAYADKVSAKKEKQQAQINEKDIRNTFKTILAYTNDGNLDGLKSYYSPNFVNNDGFNFKMYFDLVRKTWKLYPDIKYEINIDNISIFGNTAIVTASETAIATTSEKIEDTEIKGYLKSKSDTIYYLEKIGEKWVITSDSTICEETKLTYGEANEIKMELVVPQLVPANKEYTASLKVIPSDKKMLLIGSIGQEKITYPHVNASEVYRKFPESGILERLFNANNENLNEYVVGSVGITRAKVTKDKNIKLVVTGLGYIITRTNVISTKDFSKVKENGTKKTTAKLLD